MSELNFIVGARLKQKRLEHGLTQTELGAVLGSTFKSIHTYEIGRCQMPLKMLSEFAKLCEVPIDWFFIEKGSMLVYVTYL